MTGTTCCGLPYGFDQTTPTRHGTECDKPPFIASCGAGFPTLEERLDHEREAHGAFRKMRLRTPEERREWDRKNGY